MENLNPVQTLAVFAVVLLVLLILFEIVRRREPPLKRSANSRTWGEVAKRLGGALDGQAEEFSIRFNWNGRPASLTDGRSMVFKLSGGSFGSLDLEFLGRDAQALQTPPVKALDDFRDMRYRGKDERAIRAFLTVPVRRILSDLLSLSGSRTEVLIHDQLRIAGRPPRDSKSLTRFAVLCLQLAQHAKLFVEQTSAVSVVEAGTSSTGTCQICGAELGGQLVRCSRCSTPHHADCWEYTGACSTYGCGEKSFVA